MSWTNRCAVRTGSASALFAVALALAVPAAAQRQPAVWLGQTALSFSHPSARGDELAVALHDPAVQQFLKRAGATVSWQPGERYILVTTAEPRVISFAVGDARYDIGDVSARAAFAPYEKSGDVYLPFFALARALYFEPKRDGADVVLQPQIAVADIQSERDGATLVLHAALPIAGRKVVTPADRVAYDFPGFGSTLQRARKLGGGRVSEIDVDPSGTVRQPSTRVTLLFAAGSRIADARAGTYHDFTLAIAASAALRVASPAPSAAPAARAAVTSVDALESGDGFDVLVSVRGNASYEWHRLLDNRWYVDIHGATVEAAQRDEPQTANAVTALRVHAIANDTVRVALTLAGPNQVDLAPSATGLSISVKNEDSQTAARNGSGTIGAGAAAAAATPSAPPGWKFPATPSAAPSVNPHLIVIDPGHGGSDPGAGHNSLTEKAVNLDISRRLRGVLIARGWQVVMTRNSDVDVYSPNDSAHDELQARDDIANHGAARLLVSIHANSYSGSGPSGTTTYYYKPQDLPLANAVHRRLQGLGTKDDGVVRNNFYVIVHASMPAVLIETAFLSNPGDYALLTSPQFLQRIATAIADGIADYAGSGVSETPNSAP